MNAYSYGSLIKITATFTTPLGVAVDPLTVRIKTKSPDGVVTTYVYGVDEEITWISTGVYQFYISLTQCGLWRYQALGTGTNQAGEEGSLLCDTSNF
jgi:hypothetical protein